MTGSALVDRESSRRTGAAVAAGLVLVLATVVAVLDDERPRLAATNSKVNVSGVAIVLEPGEERCQGGEYIPRETARLRMFVGPGGNPLELSARYADGAEAMRARLEGGYPPGPVFVPVPSPARDVAGGVLCIHNQGPEPLGFAGNLTPLGADAQLGPNSPGARRTDEVRVDYFRPGRESWFDIAPEIADRFHLFKAGFMGDWTIWAALAAVGLLWAAVVVLLLRRQPKPSDDDEETPGTWRRAVPRMAWACAVVAMGNAAVWAVVTPSFQVPDEPIHVGYAQWLAETGTLPSPDMAALDTAVFAPDYQAVLEAMPFSIEGKPSWSERQEEDLRRQLDGDLSRRAESGAWTASAYPPLYYAYEAIPARLGSSLSPLDRLFLLRLGSAVLAGVTVLFVFMFLRELIPATPWAWTVGALAVAFQPVFGFIGGGVNNDNLLFAVCALLLALLARAFRRGLTPRLGVAIGLTVTAGVLTKPAMFGVLPGAAFGLVLLAWRGRRLGEREPLRGAALAGIVFVGTTATWYLIDAAVFGRVPGDATEGLNSGSQPYSVFSQLSYLWQFYLPKLPFMGEKFPGYPRYPVWDVLIQGFIGRFGYFQYGFPMWAYRLGFWFLLAVTALAVTVVVRTKALRRRWAEASCYLAMLGGLVVLMGVVGYRYKLSTDANFEQIRYFFPLLALYGAVVALAARGTGVRWGRPLGAFLVVLAMGHSLLSMMVTVARYYA